MALSRRYIHVEDVQRGEYELAANSSPDHLDDLFICEYAKVTRIIARIIRDQAHAEDLAIEVSLKILRPNLAHYKQRRDRLRNRQVQLLRGAVALTVCLLTTFSVPQTSDAVEKLVPVWQLTTSLELLVDVIRLLSGIGANLTSPVQRSAFG